MLGKEMARNLLQQEPGRGCRHANAADASKISQKPSGCHKPETRLQMLHVHRLYHLIEAHAQATAALIWGAY